MRRWLLMVCIFMAGCSNAPLADFLDRVAPAKIRPEFNDGIEPVAPIPPPRGESPPLPPLGAPQPANPPQFAPPLPPVGTPQAQPGDRPPPFSRPDT